MNIFWIIFFKTLIVGVWSEFKERSLARREQQSAGRSAKCPTDITPIPKLLPSPQKQIGSLSQKFGDEIGG